ncbi:MULTISPECIES: hypothetical protein [Agrococcus]|uniref:Uncharacterized protein n=1 Tax=Agrococcus pavilionensis RW1 TaxID=1330458 RepID=U1LRR4_9MICO|nr:MULTISPECIES: hypothetical protein [Agrococcus]ERG65194.1 hypothetical protein L332_12190 [Agrococcus pavilionensis RW1]
MTLAELLDPAVLQAVGIAVAFPIVVVIGVAVLRRIVARRNPELAPAPAEVDPPAAARTNHDAEPA